MGFKDLFINSDENATDKPKKVEPVKESKTKFPTEEIKQSNGLFSSGPTSMPSPTVTSNNISEEHLAKAVEIYKNGFDSLNQPGYDFYEFYQTVMQGGANNPQTYLMAFAMGSVMEKSITKQKLIEQSEFYISEINKSYNDYITKGNAKKQDLIGQKNTENQALLGELESLKHQMEAIKIQIQDRENKLSAIGGKYEPKISEIDSKLAANDLAKNQIIQSIEQVKQGIINNIK